MSATKLHDAAGLILPVAIPDDAHPATAAIQADVLHLFDECAPSLRRYIRSFGLAPESAEDVLQEVFLSLFRHLLLDRSRSNLRGWLFQVSHNLALRHRTRTSRQRRMEDTWDVGLAESIADSAASPEQQLADDQRTRRMRAALRAMPDRDRRCFFLRAEGLRYREIATAMGISLGSVAKSLARVAARLLHAQGASHDASR
jgi:RNA polymerase sigma-70 factor (ECF subfamily)